MRHSKLKMTDEMLVTLCRVVWLLLTDRQRPSRTEERPLTKRV